MTSEQAMWMVLALALLASGCHYRGAKQSQGLSAPYGERQVWAVAPLRNESGSLHANGLKAADHLAQRLETAKGIDVLPVNRVLAALEALQMQGVTSTEDAIKLRGMLGVDGLVVGTITAYDPYDPLKLGLIIELYVDARRDSFKSTDVRKLVRAATDEMSLPNQPKQRPSQPVSVVSGFYDASDPAVRDRLLSYAAGRSGEDEDDPTRDQRLYQIDMDLYTEFVTYLVSQRLLRVEQERLAPPRLAAEPAL